MKKYLILITVSLVIVFGLYGCKINCDDYWPHGVSISWTDYNTVAEVCEYFQYYNIAEQHKSDTVRLCGYILGYGRPDYYRSVYEDAAQGDGLIKIYITDNPDKQYPGRGWGVSTWLWKHSVEGMEWLLEYRAGQKVYVTAFCRAAYPADGCTNVVVIEAINVEIDNQ